MSCQDSSSGTTVPVTTPSFNLTLVSKLADHLDCSSKVISKVVACLRRRVVDDQSDVNGKAGSSENVILNNAKPLTHIELDQTFLTHHEYNMSCCA